MSVSPKPFLAALGGEVLDRPPFWLMRQAGRYLPEYREVRRQAGSFIDLCLNSELACEVTLQPLRRYGMDAAILFSDILMVPYGLGQGLEYLEGEGPKLAPVRDAAGLGRLSRQCFHDRLAPVYDTVRRIAAALPAETALIGFAGSPWTVACYMVQGGGSKEWEQVKGFAYRDEAAFGALIGLLVEVTAEYLSRQIVAGAEAVQLFDSWAGLLPASRFRRYVIEPTRQIVAALKVRHPTVPVIGFPRNAGVLIEEYTQATGIDAVALDTTVCPRWAAQHLQTLRPVQGNLDPILVMAGGEAMTGGTDDILSALAGGPLVFNLGHGVTQGTPPEHVGQLADWLRSWPERR
ncbi:MAG: uroporphyrinogen decarboxylase [Rhodospirillaceae bacterium]